MSAFPRAAAPTEALTATDPVHPATLTLLEEVRDRFVTRRSRLFALDLADDGGTSALERIVPALRLRAI
ncbi:MAG: hypothetical protein JXQ29_08735 [Planctomycetes bacterium]|nr:hypothetical protein [Planctomycetota bacterium]